MEPPRSERPVGEPVGSEPAKRPAPITLAGRYVRVVPLDAATHGEALWQGTHGTENEHLWRYLFDGSFSDRKEFDASLERKMASPDPLFFALIDPRSKLALGFASLMRIEPAHRVVEVGNILYTPALQRTRGATEAMFLLARHAFEELGYRRYEWKCDALNEPSRRAALRFGFVFEGIFRQHYIVKGKNRDTAWYSMLDGEWPVRKAAFERWLDPLNFDDSGQQRLSMAQCHRASQT